VLAEGLGKLNKKYSSHQIKYYLGEIQSLKVQSVSTACADPETVTSSHASTIFRTLEVWLSVLTKQTDAVTGS
jgi:hypothetical protein